MGNHLSKFPPKSLRTGESAPPPVRDLYRHAQGTHNQKQNRRYTAEARCSKVGYNEVPDIEKRIFGPSPNPSVCH